jgi:hypothetical protein
VPGFVLRRETNQRMVPSGRRPRERGKQRLPPPNHLTGMSHGRGRKVVSGLPVHRIPSFASRSAANIPRAIDTVQVIAAHQPGRSAAPSNFLLLVKAARSARHWPGPPAAPLTAARPLTLRRVFEGCVRHLPQTGLRDDGVTACLRARDPRRDDGLTVRRSYRTPFMPVRCRA